MSYRSYSRFLLGSLVIFVIFNYATWKCCTEVLLTKKFDGGDLARMGYALGTKQYRKAVNDLPKKHIVMKAYKGQKIDLLTIGDSFAMGGGEGRNNFFQDYIATLNDYTVLNVPPYQTDDLVEFFSPFSTLSIMINSGYLDMIKPRIIIIESAVKYCIPRFAKGQYLRYGDTMNNVRKFYADFDYALYSLPRIGFINNGNFKFMYYNFLYMFSDNAFRKKIYRRELSLPMFTAKDPKKLLFIGEDVSHISAVTEEGVKQINDNFNSVAAVLKARGIELYFMPVVDKYDLYADLIVDNPYPRNTFFDKLRVLPKTYKLIDTKGILLEEVRKGEKDIFYADDSHWTWKAEQRIFEKVKFQ